MKMKCDLIIVSKAISQTAVGNAKQVVLPMGLLFFLLSLTFPCLKYVLTIQLKLTFCFYDLESPIFLLMLLFTIFEIMQLPLEILFLCYICSKPIISISGWVFRNFGFN